MKNLIIHKIYELNGKIIAIALILLLAMSSAAAILPTTKALGTPWPYTSTPTKGSNGL